jgi:hypothetical protein
MRAGLSNGRIAQTFRLVGEDVVTSAFRVALPFQAEVRLLANV